MNFEPPPNHGTDAQDEDLELVDVYLLRVRHRAILPHFVSFISPEKNRSRGSDRARYYLRLSCALFSQQDLDKLLTCYRLIIKAITS